MVWFLSFNFFFSYVALGLDFFANRFSKINTSVAIKKYPLKSGINSYHMLLLMLWKSSEHSLMGAVEVDCGRNFKKLLGREMEPLSCQAGRMGQVLKCQADWCLSNRNRWPSACAAHVARRLAVVFGRWSLKTHKTMMSHWHKSEVTGKRMKFSVSDLAIFSVILCRISVWAHLSVLCNLFFFSEHMEGWKRKGASSDEISRANEVLYVLGRLAWVTTYRECFTSWKTWGPSNGPFLLPCSQQ